MRELRERLVELDDGTLADTIAWLDNRIDNLPTVPERTAELLAKDGIKAAVVSMPCWELFERQPESYQQATLGSAPRVAVEAAARFGWDRWLGERGRFVGMNGFGASAPAGDLYKHFGITAEAVAAAALQTLA